jgi:hypothetical protein
MLFQDGLVAVVADGEKSQLNPASPVASPSGRSALTSPVSSLWLESRRMRQD